MGKTIVLCCDGTGNTDTGVPSNVKRLHELLLFDPQRQIPTYHRGVGTDVRRPGENWFRYHHAHLTQLCFGEGVSEALLALYSTLVAQYEHGDRIFLFGFSRGAFTVRALAGLIHMCGLVRREHAGRAAEAVRLYEDAEARIIADRRQRGLEPTFPDDQTDHTLDDRPSAAFKAAYSQTPAIDFMGLWDTVKAYGWVWPRSFPALRHNTSVRTVRHAVALDERRSLFQMTGWASGHIDVKEVWFTGDHSDVGGGHTDGNSPLSNAALCWMLGEASAAELRFNPEQRRCVEDWQRSSADALRTRAKGARQRWKFFLPGCLPRFELDNHAYPPRRHFRVLWPFARRVPAVHAFGSTVYVHHTVNGQRRAGDRAQLDVEPVLDREIAWPSRG